jgi:hypothetical protein
MNTRFVSLDFCILNAPNVNAEVLGCLSYRLNPSVVELLNQFKLPGNRGNWALNLPKIYVMTEVIVRVAVFWYVTSVLSDVSVLMCLRILLLCCQSS